MGDFNVNAGTDTNSWKGAIAKHGITELNQNEGCSSVVATDYVSRISFSSTERFTSIHGIDLVWNKNLSLIFA